MECPTCGRELTTERGMRQHHTKVHDEPLPNRTCSGCGIEFYDPKARLEYCEDCNPNAGEHNGNWQSARETGVCETCGATFEYYPSNREGKYCSECVAEAEGLLPDNPREDVDPTRADCENCGTELRVPPHRLRDNQRGVFCDQRCHGKWMSRNLVGEKHHSWEPGDVCYTGRLWRIRSAALKRDQYRCQLCRKTAADMDRNPDVHHIEPVRQFKHSEDAHRMENVITLCRSCHRKVESDEAETPEP